jgi:hypothetical protein
MSDFKIKRGDTWIHEFYWADDNGEPLNITGATARMQLRDVNDDVLIEANTENGLLYLRLEAGAVVADIPFSLMDAVPVTVAGSEHRFDCELVYAGNVKDSTDTYTLEIEQDITRDETP